MTQNSQTKDHTAVSFAPATAINLVVLGIMVLAIGTGLATYFGWFVGITMGLALSYVFSALVKTLVAPAGEVTRSERIWTGVFSVLIFAVTLGFSYGALYAKLFAQASALDEFSRVRMPVQRQIETGVLSNAESALKVFAAWQQDSAKKAEQEGKEGGTCPAKAASSGKRGPIAMWRESDAGIAANLNNELRSSVASIRSKFDALKDRKATTFIEAMEITSGLNALIESSEALARGSYVPATKDTLARQLASEITWLNGESFRCGDATRDELIKRAQSALTDLADVKRNPPLQPLAPAIDLSNQQELTIRGLLRSFNAIAKVVTLGWVGSFADDPLMEVALKSKGLINRETIGFLIAGMIELCVLFTAFLAVRGGHAPFPFQPTRMLADLQTVAEQRSNALVRITALMTLAVSKFMVNLFFAQQARSFNAKESSNNPLDMDESPLIHRDPVFPTRELDWAVLLAPYLLANHDGDYLVVPNTTRCARVLMAARALEYQSAAVLLNLNVPWANIASYRPAANQFERLLPDARNLNYAIYKLTPPFAQAMRLQILQPAPVGQSTSFRQSRAMTTT